MRKPDSATPAEAVRPAAAEPVRVSKPTLPEMVQEMLGGGTSFGAPFHSELDLAEAVSSGFPTSVLTALVEQGVLTPTEVSEQVISPRSLSHRARHAQPLTREESDRVARIARVMVVAAENFGDADRAARWLRTPNHALQERIPLKLLATSEGARVVEESIYRLAHGIFA
jgi:putative toxin-antitoxin system antitoxin component (TIGR02293 family)